MARGQYSLVSELLECPVCMELMVYPVKIYQCDNGHAICETCKNNSEVSSCPSCRFWFTSASPPKRNLLAEKLAGAVIELNEIVNNMEPSRDKFLSFCANSEVAATKPGLEQIEEDCNNLDVAATATELEEAEDYELCLIKQEGSVSTSKLEGKEFLVLVGTNGLAAKKQGVHLGLYKIEGYQNGKVYYRQLDNGNCGSFLYANSLGSWVIGSSLHFNSNKGQGLYNDKKSRFPPQTGWQFFNELTGKWNTVDGIRIYLYNKEEQQCSRISITSQVHHPIEITGIYFPTQMYKRGRLVFKHCVEKFYLTITSSEDDNTCHWVVLNCNSSSQSTSEHIFLGKKLAVSLSMCPADQSDNCYGFGFQCMRSTSI